MTTYYRRPVAVRAFRAGVDEEPDWVEGEVAAGRMVRGLPEHPQLPYFFPRRGPIDSFVVAGDWVVLREDGRASRVFNSQFKREYLAAPEMEAWARGLAGGRPPSAEKTPAGATEIDAPASETAHDVGPTGDQAE